MTRTEKELLAECESIATMHGATVAEVLTDACRYWRGAGRSTHPRQWASKAAAADRLLARIEVVSAFAVAGLDATVEVENFDRLSAEQLRDQITYLSDYQG